MCEISETALILLKRHSAHFNLPFAPVSLFPARAGLKSTVNIKPQDQVKLPNTNRWELNGCVNPFISSFNFDRERFCHDGIFPKENGSEFERYNLDSKPPVYEPR